MIRYWKYAGIALLALGIIVPAASAHPRVFIGGGFYGPAFYGPGYYNWYGPGYYAAPYAVQASPYLGKVKFDTKMKDANVYVDDAFAGTVKELGTFPLRLGTHNIELRDPSGTILFQDKVSIVAGKTLKLNA
ncbi:MAG TPA: hypothetical protein VFE02_06010 [Candidatus Acidoferrales bacterium]|jgi:hypothetical protein|nr:hypothetical protein [Candidatus Acidoferrales bacterium]